jgi:spore coat polysaccharide biosynthesis protein SpsF
MGIVIIQARLSSERLQGKVLLPLLGKPVLHHVIKRAQSADVGDVILAIPDKKEDDPLAEFAEKEGIACHRGSERDVLDRYYKAALAYKPDYVVRITSDCPCLDSDVTSDTVRFFLKQKTDYVASASKEIFYHGTDTEVFTFRALEHAAQNAKRDYDREHVTPFIYKSGKFPRYEGDTVQNAGVPVARAAAQRDIIKRIRATLDTKEDYIVIRAIFELLGERFCHSDVVSLFKQHPWLSDINSAVIQKADYHDPADEFKAAARLLRLQEMSRAADYIEKAQFL